MDEGLEDCQDHDQSRNTKKKLLVQLAEKPRFAVDLHYKKHKVESKFRKSLSAGVTCRFCGKVFLSGKALGGHMRVHGALAFERGNTSSAVEMQETGTETRDVETLGSAHNTASHTSGITVAKAEINVSSSCNIGSSNSQMSLEASYDTLKIDRANKDLQDRGENIEIIRFSGADDHEYTLTCNKMSVMKKSVGERIGFGNTHPPVETVKGSRKPSSTLYELRRNPKPNQRFFRDQEMGIPITIWPTCNQAMSSVHLRKSRSPSPESERSCTVCGKVFFSSKALFGHMRCHPEREWRGIQPPERILEAGPGLQLINLPGSSYKDATMSFTESYSGKCKHVPIGPTITNLLCEEEGNSCRAHVPFNDLQSATMVSNILGPRRPQFDVEVSRKSLSSESENNHNITLHASRKSVKSRSVTSCAKKEIYHQYREGNPYLCWATRNKRSRRSRGVLLDSQAEITVSTSKATCNAMNWDQPEDLQIDNQDDLDMANCLVMLSNADHRNPENLVRSESVQESRKFLNKDVKEHSLHVVEVLENGYGGKANAQLGNFSSKRDQASRSNVHKQERGLRKFSREEDQDGEYDRTNSGWDFNPELKYRCLTCKKSFNSHQALGGHRASHRKTKGCFAQTISSMDAEKQESNDDQIVSGGDAVIAEDSNELHPVATEHKSTCDIGSPFLRQKQERCTYRSAHASVDQSLRKGHKTHKCSICHRVFASGQALGGHKRCHWTGERVTTDTYSEASSNMLGSYEAGSAYKSDKSDNVIRICRQDAIDLNMPAPFWDEDENERAEANEISNVDLVHAVLQGENKVAKDQAATNKVDNQHALQRNAGHVDEENIRDYQAYENSEVQNLLVTRKRSPPVGDIECKPDVDARYRFGIGSSLWMCETAKGIADLPQICILEPHLYANISKEHHLPNFCSKSSGARCSK
ncbi:hypothetical protein KP509_26G048800 [Ceratopteris richardii]|nr:hypothetical protein KP509_26G048800 [Ceratopteris richardii]